MRRLLRANFARLLKNKLFWILTCAELFLGALFPILHYMDNIDENSGWNMDSTIFIYALFVPLMVSLLTALFIGTDYSDGTMRNKLIAGHVRRKIYVANLISNVQASFTLCVAFMLSHVCVGTPAFGMVRVRCTYAYVLCISDIYYDSSMYSNIYFDIYVVQ